MWHALVDDAARRRWWPHLLRLDARVGGRLEERWHEGWEALPGGAALAEAHERGWRHRLEALARFLAAES